MPPLPNFITCLQATVIIIKCEETKWSKINEKHFQILTYHLSVAWNSFENSFYVNVQVRCLQGCSQDMNRYSANCKLETCIRNTRHKLTTHPLVQEFWEQIDARHPLQLLHYDCMYIFLDNSPMLSQSGKPENLCQRRGLDDQQGESRTSVVPPVSLAKNLHWICPVSSDCVSREVAREIDYNKDKYHLYSFLKSGLQDLKWPASIVAAYSTIWINNFLNNKWINCRQVHVTW